MQRIELLSDELFRKQQIRAKKMFHIAEHCRRNSCTVKLMRQIVLYLSSTATGYYSSSEVEKFYTDIAKKKHVDLSEECKPNTCLIITNDIASSGGHAQVVERWIERDKARKYSVLLTNQAGSKISERLIRLVADSGGRIYELKREEEIAMGLKIRKIASSYESVLLFTFPFDVVHLIAFGSDEFRRPVGYYNAADHLFWLGISVSDCIAEFRSWGREMSLKYRCFNSDHIVPVPSEVITSSDDRRNYCVRGELGFKTSDKVIVCAARAVKFVPISNETFLDHVEPLLAWDKGVIVVVIGPDENYFAEWKTVKERYPGRFNVIGTVAHDKLKQYYRAADLVIGSFPFESLASLEDAVSCGAPILSRSETFDWTKDSPAQAKTLDDFIKKAKSLLDSRSEREVNIRCMQRRMEEENGREIFRNRQENFMRELCSKSHGITSYMEKPTELIFNDRIVQASMNIKRILVRRKIMSHGPIMLMAVLSLIAEHLIDLALRIRR